MSTSFSILGAVVVFAAAQLLLRKDAPAYAFLLSVGAALFVLLQLGVAAGAASECTGFQPPGGRACICLPAALCRNFAADRLRADPVRRSWCGHFGMVRRVCGPMFGSGAAFLCWKRSARRSGGLPHDKKFLQKAAAFVLCTVCFLAFAPDAAAAQLQGLPGQELWQPYLEKAPQSAESFAKDPLKSLLALLPGSPAEMIRQMAHCYADVLLFLLLLIVLSFLVGGAADSALLELAAAVGCGTLLWGDLISLAQLICERMEGWKNYLLGFLPVYSGVLAAGGEVNASTAASGLLLTGLCFLAQGTVLVVSPLLQSYLAVSMACCISTQQGLSETCRVIGALLRRGLVWAGRIFAVLLGLQRAVTVQLDRSALRLGQLLTGGVPVIGQALSDTAEAFLAGMQLLKSSLGFAALAVIGAEFLPLYLQLLLHLLFLAGCRLLCGLAENRRCQALFDCMAEAVKCMAAVTALFFELLTVGVGLLMMTGGG